MCRICPFGLAFLAFYCISAIAFFDKAIIWTIFFGTLADILSVLKVMLDHDLVKSIDLESAWLRLVALISFNYLSISLIHWDQVGALFIRTSQLNDRNLQLLLDLLNNPTESTWIALERILFSLFAIAIKDVIAQSLLFLITVRIADATVGCDGFVPGSCLLANFHFNYSDTF